jgi:hypothetical protein
VITAGNPRSDTRQDKTRLGQFTVESTLRG